MTDAELIAMAVFVGMGVYISYLHHKLNETRFHAGFMADILVRIARKELELKTNGEGFTIIKPKGE